MLDHHAECMKGVFFVVQDGQPGIECDACRKESITGDKRYQVGKVLFCGPCAILAAKKILTVVALRESELSGGQTLLDLDTPPTNS